MTHHARSTAAAPLAPVAALLIVALALRPQLSAIGPLANSIMADLGVSHAFVGLLTTIPVLCMGIFALVGPGIAGLVGVRAGITLSVAILVASAILRALAPGELAVLVLTFGIGVGTGVIGPILPMFVRGRLSARIVGATAAYAGGIIVGAAIASGVAVPLLDATGGWRGAMLALSCASIVALVVWMLLVRGMPGQRAAATAGGRRGIELPALPLRRPVAWGIGLLFGLQSWLYYGTTAWLANVYVERGWDPAAAGALLTLMSIASMSAIVLAPGLSSRGASRRTLLAGAAVASAVGLAGVIALPDAAALWAALVGAGLGMTFTLALTLPVDISDDQREVGGAAAMMLLVGYLLASAAPFVLGAVRDATGDFGASLWLLVAIALAIVPLALSLAPHRLRPAAG